MRRSGRALLALGVALAAVAVAGCGRDDFENEPRPPVAAEISVKIGSDAVVVSPPEFGAGLANFTVANLGDSAATLEILGPSAAESGEVSPGGTATLKTEMVTGNYVARARGTSAEAFDFRVGAERESAQDDLLLP